MNPNKLPKLCVLNFAIALSLSMFISCGNNPKPVSTDNSETVLSKVLMRVEYNKRWTTKGRTGNLILKTDSTKTYEGTVEKDQYGHVNVTVGKGVTWSLTADTDLDKLTVEQGGIVKTNGHKLNYQTADIKGKIL